jgi:hypothetical protein
MTMTSRERNTRLGEKQKNQVTFRVGVRSSIARTIAGVLVAHSRFKSVVASTILAAPSLALHQTASMHTKTDIKL